MKPLDSMTVSVSQARRIDRLCDDYEQARRAGKQPDIAAYVAQAAVSDRPRLMAELAAIDREWEEPTDGGQPEVASRFSKHTHPASGTPVVRLAVTGGPNRGRQFAFTEHDTFIVGRGRAAQLKLPPRDKFFSRHHFLLEVNPPCCRLTNLSATNGTLVNGKRAQVAELAHGDVILAGGTELRVDIKQAAPRVAASVETQGQSANRVGGQRVGAYHLLRQLGSGQMGAVWLAKHDSSGCRFAIKMLRMDSADPAVVQRFAREAAICQRLSHPHIVQHHETFEESGRLYLVMEHVDGDDARRLLSLAGQLPLPRACDWISQVLLALEYAHERGFVHRDIKPGNLLIAREDGKEYVKLADFGLARAYQSSSLSGLTIDGEVAGSLPFMAPEQITHFKHVSPQSDLYAVGATLYTLVTGEFPYDFPSRVSERIAMVLDQPAIDISQRLEGLPPAFCQVIHKSLARALSARFQSARAMREALLPFC